MFGYNICSDILNRERKRKDSFVQSYRVSTSLGFKSITVQNVLLYRVIDKWVYIGIDFALLKCFCSK